MSDTYEIHEIQLNNKNPIVALSFSEQLDAVIVGQVGDESSLSIVEFGTGRCIYYNVIENAILNAAYPAESYEMVVYICNGNDIYLLNLDTFHNCGHFSANKNVRSIKIKGRYMILSGEILGVWNLQNGQNIWTYPDYRAGEWVKSWSYSKLECNWWLPDYKDGQPFVRKPLCADFLQDDNQIVISGNCTCNVEVIDWTKNDNLLKIGNAPLQCTEILVSNKMGYVFTTGIIPDANFLWRYPSGERILQNVFNEYIGGTSCASFHPDDTWIVTGSQYGHLVFTCLEKAESIIIENLHNGKIQNVVFKDGNHVITGGVDGRVFVIEFEQ